ncbi:MAG: thioredoxin domain-containing protein, partial [Acidobacteriota bacterium]
YSSCHWCHVMREESFSNKDVAALLNESFVPILVDREERPDLDSVYLAAAEVLNGSAGWPLNLILTPEGKPFFAATYIPLKDLNERPGMLRLLPQVSSAWRERSAEIRRGAEQVTTAMTTLAKGNGGGSLDEGVLKTAFEEMRSRSDAGNGGFLPAPKFPSAHRYLFLLRYWKRTGDGSALAMVTTSLEAMRNGAINDQLGSGFHRYSTDAAWNVPHFEKMLYDQAMLSMLYAEAWQATGNESFRRTAVETLDYVVKNLRAPGGAFHASEDADSGGTEGAFYLWTAAELKSALGNAAPLFIQAYGVTPAGNFEDGMMAGVNVLHRVLSDDELARARGISAAAVHKQLAASRNKLLSVRSHRPHPAVDTKVLADWNGLMIAALAEAAQILDQPRYAAAAQSAADYLLSAMRSKDGSLLHSNPDGKAAIPATLEDYAYTVWGLLNLYEASFEVQYLQAALAMEKISIEKFWDSESGGFFLTASGGERLLLRPRLIFDDDKPSGNSVQMMNLVRLARMTGDQALEERAGEMSRAFAGDIKRSPASAAYFLSALSLALGPSFEVVIAGDPAGKDTASMLRALRSQYIPNKVLMLRPPGDNPPITRLAPFTEEQRPQKGQATAYVCTNFNCRLPTNDPQVMLEQLKIAPPVLKSVP